MNYEKQNQVIIPPFDPSLKLPTNNNSRYFYNDKIKELIIDVVFNTDSGGKPRDFKLKLADPLMIDVEHDIFLDTVITYNLKSSKLPHNMAFLLKIDQFNIQTKSATNIIKPGKPATNTTAADNEVINNRINNSIMIPNEKKYETIEQYIAKSGSQIANGTNTGSYFIHIDTGQTFHNQYKNYTIMLSSAGKPSIISNVTSSTYSEVSGQTSIKWSQFGRAAGGELQRFQFGAIDSSWLDNGVAGAGPAAPGEAQTYSDDPTTSDIVMVEIYEEHNNHSTIHKGRKHNYVGTIAPSKLMNITGSVSDMGMLEFESNTAIDGNLGTSDDGNNRGQIIYGNPFHDMVGLDDVDAQHQGHHLLERMIAEFKLVPRQ